MAKLDKDTIKSLTQLSRIACSEEEQESLLNDLKKILNYVDQLHEVKTENVPPCYQVLEGMVNVYREDKVGATLSRPDFLSNVPKSVGGLVSVPPVIKGNDR